MTIDEGHYYNYLLFVVITYGKVCLWLWKTWKTRELFLSYFVASLCPSVVLLSAAGFFIVDVEPRYFYHTLYI